MPGIKRHIVHEIFGCTIQGEGGMVGTPCHFIRLAGCNAWSGRDEDRAASLCPFCDTQFRGGDHLTTDEILDRLRDLPGHPHWVTISGGEPMLQVSSTLLRALREDGWKIAIETNGTINIPRSYRRFINHLTLSPKLPRAQTLVTECDTLKLLYPHPNPLIRPEAFADIKAKYRFLQPITPLGGTMMGDHVQVVVKALLERYPDWRLSLQTHLALGVQ